MPFFSSGILHFSFLSFLYYFFLFSFIFFFFLPLHSVFLLSCLAFSFVAGWSRGGCFQSMVSPTHSSCRHLSSSLSLLGHIQHLHFSAPHQVPIASSSLSLVHFPKRLHDVLFIRTTSCGLFTLMKRTNPHDALRYLSESMFTHLVINTAGSFCPWTVRGHDSIGLCSIVSVVYRLLVVPMAAKKRKGKKKQKKIFRWSSDRANHRPTRSRNTVTHFDGVPTWNLWPATQRAMVWKPGSLRSPIDCIMETASSRRQPMNEPAELVTDGCAYQTRPTAGLPHRNGHGHLFPSSHHLVWRTRPAEEEREEENIQGY